MRQFARLSITIAILFGLVAGTARTPRVGATTMGSPAHLSTVVVGKGQRVTVMAKPRTRVVVLVKPGAGTDQINITMRGDVTYYDGQHGIVNVNPLIGHTVCVRVGPCKCPEGTWRDGPELDESVGLGSFTITLVGGKKKGATATLTGQSMDEDCTKHDPCLRGTWKVTDLTTYLTSFHLKIDSTSGNETYRFYGKKKKYAATAQAQSYAIVAESKKETGTVTITLNGMATASNWITPEKGSLQLSPSGDWTAHIVGGETNVTFLTGQDRAYGLFGPWAHQATGTYVCNSTLAGITGAELEYSPFPGHPPIVMTRVSA